MSDPLRSSLSSALYYVAEYSGQMCTAKDRRDGAIVWALESGATYSEVAKAAKMTSQGVRKLVARNVALKVDNSVVDNVSSQS